MGLKHITTLGKLEPKPTETETKTKISVDKSLLLLQIIIYYLEGRTVWGANGV